MVNKIGGNFYIMDPVVGDLHVDKAIKYIIEKPEFQRLRYIKQLGFAYLVFPGAHHTRFEHSLGTWSITKDFSKNILSHDNPELAIAGLLHDIGHMPFSHESEGPMYKYIKLMHEGIGRNILKESELLDRLGDYGMSKKRVIGYFDGIGEGSIVTGPLGSDRADYLMRDAYYTGVAYGIIDYNWIKNILTIYKDEPAAYMDHIDSIESFFIARYYMYSSVYFHRVVITANAMYRKALALGLEGGNIDPKEFVSMDDDEAIHAIIDSGSDKGLLHRVLERHLFKQAYFEPNFTSEIKTQELDDIAQKAGLDNTEYIAEVHGFKGNNESVRLLSKSKKMLGNLAEKSEMFKILSNVLEKRKVIVVSCDPKNAKKLHAAIEKAL